MCPGRCSPFAPRNVIGGKDARTLARALLAMSEAEFTGAFKGSPVKRARCRDLTRNAAVALGSVRAAEDVPTREDALRGDGPIMPGSTRGGRVRPPQCERGLTADRRRRMAPAGSEAACSGESFRGR